MIFPSSDKETKTLGGTAMVKINGTESETAGQTILAYLTALSYDPDRVAVERNGSIVPKALYHTTVLADGDVLEIVRFVGGG